MNILILLGAMAAFPLLVLIFNLFALNRLKMQRDHDRMLYRLCAIRDEMALMALDGSVGEETRIFKFFYSTIAGMIHHHRQAGLCFRGMIRFFDHEIREMPKESDDVEGTLGDEIQGSSKAVQRLAHEFCQVMIRGFIHSIGFIIFDRAISKFKKIDYYSLLKKLMVFSSANQNVLEFCQSIDRPGSHGNLTHA